MFFMVTMLPMLSNLREILERLTIPRMFVVLMELITLVEAFQFVQVINATSAEDA